MTRSQMNSPKRARNRLLAIRGEVAALISERKRLEPYIEWNRVELDRISRKLNELDAEEKRITRAMTEAA